MARRWSSGGSGEVAGGCPTASGGCQDPEEHQEPSNVILISAHMTDHGSNSYEEVCFPAPALSDGAYNSNDINTYQIQSGYKSKTLPRSAKFSLNHSGSDKIKTSKLSAMKLKLLGRSVEKDGQVRERKADGREGQTGNSITPPVTPTKVNKRGAGLLGSKALSRSMESLFKSRKVTKTYSIDLDSHGDGPSNNDRGTCDTVISRNFNGPRLVKPTGPPPPVPVTGAYKTKPRSKSMDFDKAFDSDSETGREQSGSSCRSHRPVGVPGPGVSKPTGPPPPVPTMGPATRRLRGKSVDMTQYGTGCDRYNIYGNVAFVSAPRPTVPPPPVPGSVNRNQNTTSVINVMTGGQEDRDCHDGVIADDPVGTDLNDRQVAAWADREGDTTATVTEDTSQGHDNCGGTKPSAAPFVPRPSLATTPVAPPIPTSPQQRRSNTFRRSLSLDCLPDQCGSDPIHWGSPAVSSITVEHRSGSEHTEHTLANNDVHITQFKSRPAVKKKPRPGTPPKPKLGGLLGSQKKSFSQSLESLLVRREELFSQVVSIDISGEDSVNVGNDGSVPGTPEEGGHTRKEELGINGHPAQVPRQVEVCRDKALALCAESSVDEGEQDIGDDENKSGPNSVELIGEFSEHSRNNRVVPLEEQQQRFGRWGTHTELTSSIQELTQITRPEYNTQRSVPLSYTHRLQNITEAVPNSGKDYSGKPMDFKAFLTKNNSKSKDSSKSEEHPVQSDATMLSKGFKTEKTTPKGYKSALLQKKPLALKSVLRNRNRDQDEPKEPPAAVQSDLPSRGLQLGKATPAVKGFTFENKSESKRSADDKALSGPDSVKKALVPPSKPFTEIIASRRSVDGTDLASRLACVDIHLDSEKDSQQTPPNKNGTTPHANDGVIGKAKSPPKPPPKVKPAVPYKKVETKLKFQRQKTSSTDSEEPPTPPVADSAIPFTGSNVSPRSPTPSPSRLSPAESTAAYIRASTPKGYAKGSVFTYTNLNKDKTSEPAKPEKTTFPFYATVNKPDLKDSIPKPSDIKLKLRENKKVSESKPRPTLPTKPGQLLSKLQSQAAVTDHDITDTIQITGEESIYDDTRGSFNTDTGDCDRKSEEADLYDDLAAGRGKPESDQVNTNGITKVSQRETGGHTPTTTTQSECYDDVEFPVRSNDITSSGGSALTTAGHGCGPTTAPTSGTSARGRGGGGGGDTGRDVLKVLGPHQSDNHSLTATDNCESKLGDTQSERPDTVPLSDNEETECYELLTECTSGKAPAGTTREHLKRSHQYDQVYADIADPSDKTKPLTFRLGQPKGKALGQQGIKSGPPSSGTTKDPYGGEGIYEELPDFSPNKAKHKKTKPTSKGVGNQPEVTKDGINNSKNVKNAGGLGSRLQFGRKGDKKATAKPQYTPIARIEPFRPSAYDEVYIEGRALRVQLNELYDDLSLCKSVITKDDAKVEDTIDKPEGNIPTEDVPSESTAVITTVCSENPPEEETAVVTLRRPKGSKLKSSKCQSLDGIKKSKSAADMDLASILRQRRPEDTVSLGSNAESVSSVDSAGADGDPGRRLSSPADPASYLANHSLGHSESDPALSEGAEGDPHMWSHDRHMKHLAKVNHKVNKALGAKHLSKMYVANIKEKTATFKNIPKYISKSATSIQEHLQGSRKSLGDLSEQVQRMFGLSKKDKADSQKGLPSVPKPDYHSDDSDADWSDFKHTGQSHRQFQDSDDDVGVTEQWPLADSQANGLEDDEDYTDPDCEIKRPHCYPPVNNSSDACYLTPKDQEMPKPPPVRPPVTTSRKPETPPPVFPRPISKPVKPKVYAPPVSQPDSDEDSLSDGYETPEIPGPQLKPVTRYNHDRPPAPIPVSVTRNVSPKVSPGTSRQDPNRLPSQAKPSPPPKPKPNLPSEPKSANSSSVSALRDKLEKKTIPFVPPVIKKPPSVSEDSDQTGSGEASHVKSARKGGRVPNAKGQTGGPPLVGRKPTPGRQPAPLPSSLTPPTRSADTSPQRSPVDRPLPPVPPPEADSQDLDGLYPQPWYFGSLPRDAANQRLYSVGQDSTFLVRKSNSGGEDRPFTLTMLFNGKVWNLQIRRRPDKLYALGTEKDNEKAFNEVSDLIRYHQESNLILAGSNGGETTLKHCPKKTGQ